MDEEAGVRERFWHPTVGQTVLDVGCYHGSYTIPALEAGARVHAFDANRDALRTLPQHSGLTTVDACISDGHPYTHDMAARIPEAMRPNGPWDTIDAYVQRHRLHVDWIKLDIEGGELAALQGARRTLEQQHPRLLIEEHELVSISLLVRPLVHSLRNEHAPKAHDHAEVLRTLAAGMVPVGDRQSA